MLEQAPPTHQLEQGGLLYHTLTLWYSAPVVRIDVRVYSLALKMESKVPQEWFLTSSKDNTMSELEKPSFLQNAQNLHHRANSHEPSPLLVIRLVRWFFFHLERATIDTPYAQFHRLLYLLSLHHQVLYPAS